MGLFLVGLSEGVARSLARYVSGDPRVALTGVAPSLALAGMLLPLTQPDVVLLDWAVLTGAFRGSVQDLRVGRPGLRVVCVAGEVDSYRDAAARAGADAVISIDKFAEGLESTLREFFPQRYVKTGDQHD